MTASVETSAEPVAAAKAEKRSLRDRFNRRGWRQLVIAIPYCWLLFFFLAPFGIVVVISMADAAIAIPPFRWGGDLNGILASLNYNFGLLVQDPLYWYGYLNSLKIAATATVLCLLIGYPMAYGIARATGAWRNILLLLVILPFWTSFLLRIYAWMGMLNNHGAINNVLMFFHVIDKPVQLMNTDFAVYIGIVYSYLPFMILPLYANLERLDITLNEAAMDLGSRPWRTFLDITLPLSVPGIIAGAMLVFIPATGEYVIPALLGRSDSPMIGRVLFDEFFLNRDWPVASAVAVVLLVLLVVPIMIFNHYQARQAEAGT